MTRTAISPRLAMRTFFSTLRLSKSLAGGGGSTAPRRYNTVTGRRVSAMSGTRFTDIRRFDSVDSTNRYLLAEAAFGGGRGGRGRGRVPDSRPGSARPPLGGAGRFEPVGLGVAPAGIRSRSTAPGLWRRGPGRRRRHRASGPDAPRAQVAQRPARTRRPEGGRRPGRGRRVGRDGPGEPPGPRPAVVVGIGINVNWPASEDDLPPGTASGRPRSLRQLAGSPVDRGELLEPCWRRSSRGWTTSPRPAGRARLAAELMRPVRHARRRRPGRAGRRAVRGPGRRAHARRAPGGGDGGRPAGRWWPATSSSPPPG